MSERSPRVAVIVPCYNDGLTVADAVASVEEREPVELVVVDDGSSDEHTREVLGRLEADGVRVLRHEHNRGLPEARTTGLGATSAPYVFPLDSDDLAVPGSLARLADALDETPSADAAYGDWVQFGAVESLVRVPRTFDPYLVAWRNRYPVASLFRRSFLEAVGGWRSVDGMVGYEDWDLWMSLAERGSTAVFTDTIAVRYRVHGVRMLRSVAGNHAALYAALRARHPKLFAELREHRRRSSLSLPARLLYPALYGRRRPTGIWRRAQELGQAVRRGKRRSRTAGAPPQSPQ
jgi:glycosyltransferase involved in cell wall biosynthesis